MSTHRHHPAWLMLLALLVLHGCAGPRRELHPLSGDEFTLFPPERSTPPKVACTGEVNARLKCFVSEFERRAARHDLGGALAFVTPDGRVQAAAQGDSLNGGRVAFDQRTRFPAGSVTKSFMAAAVVSLALEGKLDLHRPIQAYLPELSGGAGVGGATLHQLLTHTAGLGSQPQCRTGREDLKDLVSQYGRAPLWAPPGAVYDYSNLGYSFAALVVERVTGQDFEDAVRDRALVPVGIPGAGFSLSTLKVRGHSAPGVTPAPRCRAMWPSGGLVLSALELGTWARALARPDDSPLGRDLVEQLTAPRVETGQRPHEVYGYGLVRSLQSGEMILSHTGALEDFTAFVGWSPRRRVAVAAFLDSHPHGPSAMATGFTGLSTLLDLDRDWQGPAKPLHSLESYAGQYVDEVGTLGRLRVSLEGDGLAIDYLDGPPPLLPATFRFAFAPGESRAAYVVTAIGVGRRTATAGLDVGHPPSSALDYLIVGWNLPSRGRVT